MVMGLWPLYIVLLLKCGDRHLTSESDVCRRQILTSNVDPRAVKVNIESQMVVKYDDMLACHDLFFTLC